MASKYLVRPELLDALIQAESGWNSNAVSPKGAQGLAQVMPSTGKNPGFGVKPLSSNDPRDHMRFANDYLGALLDKFNGNEALAVAAYNAGPGAVSKHGGIPPYQETMNYVGKIGRMLNPMSEAQAETQPSGNGVMTQESKPNSLNNAEAAWEKYQASIKKPSLNPAEAAWERYQSSIQQTKPEAPKQSGIQSAIVDMGKALEPTIDFVQGLRGSGLKSLQGISSYFGDNQVSDFFKDEAKDMTDASQSTAGSVGRFAGDVAPFLMMPQMKVAEGAGYLGHAIPEVANLLSNAQLAQMLTPGSDDERDKAFANAGIGGAIGATVAPVLGGVIKGFTPSKAAKAAMDEGVQPTLGQGIDEQSMFGLGKWVKKAEEGLATPWWGFPVHGARARAEREGQGLLLRQANLDLPAMPGKAPAITINPALDKKGRDAVDVAYKQAKSGYNSLLNDVQIRRNPGLKTELISMANKPSYDIVREQRASAKGFIEDQINRLKDNSTASDYKTVAGDLWKEANKIRSVKDLTSSDRHKANLYSDVAEKLKEKIYQNLSPERAAYLKQLDNSYGNIRTMKSAAATLKTAKNNGDITAGELLKQIRASDKTAGKDAFSRGQARMQKEAEMIDELMSNKLGDSGTALRSWMNNIGTGVGLAGVAAEKLPLMASLAGISLVGSARPVQKALLGGYQGQHQLGDMIREYLAGAGAGIGSSQSQ